MGAGEVGGPPLTLSEGLSTGDINRSAQRETLFRRTQPQPRMFSKHPQRRKGFEYAQPRLISTLTRRIHLQLL